MGIDRNELTNQRSTETDEIRSDGLNRLPAWLSYVLTALAEIALTAILILLQPVFPIADLPMPYIILIIAVGYYVGPKPAILAFIMGLLSYIYFFLPPFHHIWPPANSPEGWARLTGFFVGTAVVAVSIELMRRSKRRSDDLARELRQSNERTTRLLESISDAFVSLDREWRFTYVNREAERMMQRSRSELIGKVFWDVFPEEAVGRWRDKGIEAMLAQTPTVVEDYWSILDIWIEMRAYPSDEGLSVYTSDITERKRTEEALRESERKYKNLIDTTSTGYVVLDTEGKVVDANLEYAKLAGHAEVDEIIGHGVLEWTAKYDLERNNQEIEKCIETGSVRNLQIDYISKDGVTTPIELNANMIDTRDGKRILTLCRDISDRKQAEEALRNSERKYRQLFDSANDAIFLLSISEEGPGRFIDANEAACRTLGYSREQLLQMTPTDIDAPETHDKIKVTSQKLLEQGYAKIETVHVSATGERIPVEINLRLFELMGEKVLLAIARDITERKRAEEALRKSEERFRSLIDTMNEGFATTDADYVFTYVNTKLAQILDYSPDELIGRPLIDFLDEKSRATMLEQITERKAGMYRPYELEWVKKDGQRIYGLVSPRALFDEEGRFAGSFGVVTDITELKETEEALRESEKRYQDLYDSAPDMFASVDAETALVIRCNETLARVTGYTKDEIVGQPVFNLYHPDSLEGAKKAFQAFATTGVVKDADLQLRRKDGSKVYVSLNVSSVRDNAGKILYSSSILRDITERKRIEAELVAIREEAERRAAELESTVASLADGVMLFNIHGEVMFINEVGRHILEIPEGQSLAGWLEMLDRYDLEGKLLPAEESPAYRALNGEIVRDMRYTVVTPWGKLLVVSASASPIRDTEGNIAGASLVYRDQSERVQFERERQQLLEREHYIAQMLQQALLPSQQAYDIGGYRIALRYQPGSKELTIGGDFYDVFEIGDGKIGVVIGDVAGKGLSAAIRVAASRYAIRSYAYLDPSPAVALTLANNALSKGDEDDSSMLTAVYAVIDTRNNTLTYGNAGHEPPLVIDRTGNMRQLEPTGLALGIMENQTYRERSLFLEPGELVVMFTDGITESRHDRTIFFDSEGVVDYLRDCKNCTPDEVASGLLEAAKAHAGGVLQDDAAIVVFGLYQSQ